MKTSNSTPSAFNQVSPLQDGKTSSQKIIGFESDPTASFQDCLEQTSANALSHLQGKLAKSFFKPNVKAKEQEVSKSKLEPRAKLDSDVSKNSTGNSSVKPSENSPKQDDSRIRSRKDDSAPEDDKTTVSEKKSDPSKKSEDSSKDQDVQNNSQSSQQTQAQSNPHAAPKENPSASAQNSGENDPSKKVADETVLTKSLFAQEKTHSDKSQKTEAQTENLKSAAPDPTQDSGNKNPSDFLNQGGKKPGAENPNQNLVSNNPGQGSDKVALPSDVKVISVSTGESGENPDYLPKNFIPSEKSAEQGPAEGKNLTAAAPSARSADTRQVIPASLVLSAMAAAESASKGELGIKDALKSYMRESPNMIAGTAELENNPKGVTGGQGATPANPLRPHQHTTPVRMAQLIERVQEAIESQTPPSPKQIVFQVEPHSLGLVQVNMKWSSEGWNVNWSVTQNEVRDWLSQQLPQLQQNNGQTPIVWHPPTLNTNPWDLSRQQGNPFAQSQQQNADRLLSDEEKDEDPKVKPASNEYWA